MVAEAFAAIWEQLQRGVGPSDGFRPYLFGVARNITAKSYRTCRQRVTNLEIAEEVPAENQVTMALCEDERDVIAAFRELPERWRAVLWLTEVEEVPRRRVAEQLGLTPNGVSVMMRRAKEGLRLAWLHRQLPEHPACEHATIGELLQKYVRGRLSSERTSELRAHLSSCDDCATLLADIRIEDRRLGGRRDLTPLLIGAVTLGDITLRDAAPAAAAGGLSGTGTGAATGLAGAGGEAARSAGPPRSILNRDKLSVAGGILR